MEVKQDCAPNINGSLIKTKNLLTDLGKLAQALLKKSAARRGMVSSGEKPYQAPQ